jgi:predicted nucleic acid-binding protein
VSRQPVGLLDSNVLIHALTRDEQGDDCRAFLRQVQSGVQQILLTSIVVHEVAYAMGRYAKQMSREEIGDYLISFMALPAVEIDDELLIDAVRIWSRTPGLGFVDAYLGIRAEQDRVPVFTKNLKHFRRFDIELPDPLESYTP